MKNVFAINVSRDKDNKTYDGEMLVTDRLSETEISSADRNAEQVSFIDRKPGYNSLLEALRIISLLILLITVSIYFIYRHARNIYFFERFVKSDYFITVFIISAVVLSVISFIRHFLIQKNKDIVIYYKNTTNQLDALMKIPLRAEKVDVIAYRYSVDTNGKTKIVSNGLFKYYNLEVKLWSDDDSIYLADSDKKFEIPLDCVRKIKYIKKRLAVFGWSKDDKCNSGKYRGYGMYLDGSGKIHIKSYFSLEFIYDNVKYEILFPPYELDSVKKITKSEIDYL